MIFADVLFSPGEILYHDFTRFFPWLLVLLLAVVLLVTALLLKKHRKR